MRHLFGTSLAALLTLAASQALANLENLDANGDGMVSYEELSTAIDIGEGEFNALDGNGDGLLDADEIAAAQQAGSLPGTL